MPIEIEATPERVWQVLTDFAAYPDWNPFFITRASGAARPSERLHLRMQPPGGRGATLRPIVLEADPGRRLRWLGHVPLTGLFDGDHSAARLARQLDRAGVRAGALHGDLPQGARERALAAFAAGMAPVLVATDVAARGIHVEGVGLVVHFDPPVEHKTYLHRSGRTARAGAAGNVVTLVLPEQAAEVAQLRPRAGVRTDPASADVHGTISALPREHTARPRRHRSTYGRR